MNIPIRILYLALHSQLKKKYGIDTIISVKDFYCKLGKHGQVPKQSRYLVIKEMEEMKLIKQESRDHIKILNCEWDIERDTNKFYEWLKIYLVS
jgi:hypothetical protein